MTEEHARTLWCPMARESGGPDAVYWNKHDSGPRCIGSDCMAWRWLDSGRLNDLMLDLGYCGLAGKP